MTKFFTVHLLKFSLLTHHVSSFPIFLTVGYYIVYCIQYTEYSTVQCTWWRLYCAVGWSDLALFCDFRTATRFCWSGIFLGGQLKKNRQISRPVRVQSFHFQKFAGALFMNIFVWKFAESFLIHKRTIANNKIRN